MKRRLPLLLCGFALLALSACAAEDAPSNMPQQDIEAAGLIRDSGSQEPSRQEDVSAVPGQPGMDDSKHEPTAPASGSSQQITIPTSPTTSSTETPHISTTPPVSEPTPPNEAVITSPPEPEESGPRILIAYFTWADNTVVDDPASVDVDATTSASVLAPGHVAQMAGWIQAETGGNLFSIQTAAPYSSDYDECLDRAADEKADNARPVLSGSVSNMADYDVVFLGYPDWWSTCPMAVFSFLDSYDFSGKTVIPFCAHGTSGLGSSVRDIKAALPGVTVLDAVGVQRPGMDTPLSSAESTVKNWLAGLNY